MEKYPKPTLLLVASFVLVMQSRQALVDGLKCYTDLVGKQVTTCRETEGFRTCFTKYNDKGMVTGRGCSTKDKVFYKECETHSYGDSVEKMCFCSFFLCNASSISTSPNMAIIMLGLLVLAVVNQGIFSSNCDTETSPTDLREGRLKTSQRTDGARCCRRSCGNTTSSSEAALSNNHDCSAAADIDFSAVFSCD